LFEATGKNCYNEKNVIIKRKITGCAGAAMRLYSVINMDIVASRQVKDRQKLQEKLNNYINYINCKYADILTSPAAITLGDEWQLITHKPSESYNLVHEFQQLLWQDDIELYAGIGIGELSTPVSDDIRKMDGPCFHCARDAFNIAKNVDKLKSKYNISKLNKVFLLTSKLRHKNLDFDILDFYYTSKARYYVQAMQEIAATADVSQEEEAFQTAAVTTDAFQEVTATAGSFTENNKTLLNRLLLERTINLIIENNEILKAKMTKKQKEVYISYTKLGSYRKVADLKRESARETIGGISQKLNNASYFTIQRNHEMVSALLHAYCSMGE